MYEWSLPTDGAGPVDLLTAPMIPFWFARETRGQKIDKTAHLGRELPTGGIDETQICLDRFVVRHQLHKAPGCDIRSDDEGRIKLDAITIERRRVQDLRVVHFEPAAHSHRFLGSIWPGEMPLGPGLPIAEFEAVCRVRSAG